MACSIAARYYLILPICDGPGCLQISTITTAFMPTYPHLDPTVLVTNTVI
jgi:hypothetical protein